LGITRTHNTFQKSYRRLEDHGELEEREDKLKKKEDELEEKVQ
jgi:hypothetical protein